MLPAGTYYTRVRAVNGAGTSAPSPETSVVVTEPSPIPGPPGNFFARTIGRTVAFMWTASTAGAAATSYTIEAGSASGLADLAQLITGTRRDIARRAQRAGRHLLGPGARRSNAAGVGAPSQDVSIVMGSASGCVGLPGAPVLLTPVISGTNVSLNWNRPRWARCPRAIS